MLLTEENLRELGIAVFEAAGAEADMAASIADALVAAEMEGLPSHGFSRIPFYLDQAKSGKANIKARPIVKRLKPGAVMVDARHGFAFPAIEAGLQEAAPGARQNGICGMGVTHSHHCGILGYYAEKLAKDGLISLIFSNTPKAMAPWGGSSPSFGTNPIAFGCPRKDDEPLVIDLSLSKVARGKIMTAKQNGEKIPMGWALDADGAPTDDPEAALKGTMIPMGDAKGSALALMVEILSAALTGANYAYEASSFFEAAGSPPGIGQFFILIDPFAFNQDFSSKLEKLFEHILNQKGTRLPGERREKIRQEKRKTGVELADKLYADIKARLKS